MAYLNQKTVRNNQFIALIMALLLFNINFYYNNGFLITINEKSPLLYRTIDWWEAKRAKRHGHMWHGVHNMYTVHYKTTDS